MIPKGPKALILHKVMIATRISATPITVRIFVMSSLDTILAPMTAPTTDAAIIRTSVKESACTFLMKMVASTQIGIAKLTFKDPGIRSSLLDLVNFQADVYKRQD